MSFESAIYATLKRFIYVALGLAMVFLGVFLPTVLGHPLPPWKRVLIVLFGLFYVYCGSMYYFPSGRRKRAELHRLLDEAEAEIEGRNRNERSIHH
jgi:hypothetical protein